MIPDVFTEKEEPSLASEPSTLSNQGISRLCSTVMVAGNVIYKLLSTSLWADVFLSALFPQVQALVL